MEDIGGDIPVEELIERFPSAVAILYDLGFRCISCGEPLWGTLAEEAERQGITDITHLLSELNRRLRNQNKAAADNSAVS